MRVTNILDPIHDELDRRVWDDPGSDKPTLKPKHLHWIKKTIYGALEQAGYTDVEKWLHIVLTGSLTTYQYSDESDCDVSLFVDAKALPEWSRAEMIGVMVGKVDGTPLPGTPHPMQDFVVGRGISPHDLYKPGLRSGYDLDAQKWIEPPDRNRVHDVQSEENGFYSYALQMADKMERLLRYEPDKAVEFWHAIHKRRQRDMVAGKGDFAESNIVYKFLANRGLFPAISEASGEYIASVQKTAGGDWFAPSYMIPDDAKQQIHEWTQGQQWPEGTKFQDPSKYHVTGLYSPQGFSNPEHQQWANNKSGISYPVQTTGVESFSPAEGQALTPTVLRVHNPDLVNDTEGIMNEAEQRGLPISRFPGGYKPHITVAHTPEQMQLEHPGLQFPVGPLRDLHGYYDELKQHQARTSMAVPLYHVAPTSARESIEQNGLMGHERSQTESPWSGEHGQPADNYFWDDPDAAASYVYPLHDQITQSKTGEYPGDEPEQFADHGVYNGTISTPSEDNEEEYDEEPYNHKDPEHRAMLPSHLQGYDVWHVPEHGLQNVQRDPENLLIKQHQEGGDWLSPQQALERTRQMEEEHEDPNYEGSGALRYYTPEHVPPDKLSLHQHIPAWEMTQDNFYNSFEDNPAQEYPEPYHHVPINDWESYKPPEHGEWESSVKIGANVLYNPFNPEKFHPPVPGHEKSMPWVYDPDSQTVHLGPPRAYHWELIQRTPELRDQYQGAWTQPAMGQAGNIHGAMSWPSRKTDFMGEQVDPETKQSINQALGAPEDEHEWNF